MYKLPKGMNLAIAVALMAGLFLTTPTNVPAQTGLKIIEDALPTLKPVPEPSFPGLQPGPSDSRYAACNTVMVPFNRGGQKALQVYIDMTYRRARCIEENTAGSAALYDRSLVDVYQGKYTELNAALVASQEVLDREKSISKKQLIDYSNYVNEEISLLMALSAYAECKALEANSLAMKVDPKCETERLQEILVSRDESVRSQHSHTQSLFKNLELEPFRALPVIAGPQELTAMVVARVYRVITVEAMPELSSTPPLPPVQEAVHSDFSNPGLLDPCAWLVALMSNADFWREQASSLEDKAAMARDVARRWRVISLSVRAGATSARKSGLTSSERLFQRNAAELENWAREYEAKAKNYENQAKLLRENAGAEDSARPEHQLKWCAKYKKSPRTAFASEVVKFKFPRPASVQQEEAIEDREDESFTEYDVMYIDREIYTADDIKNYLERWRFSQFMNDPLIVGSGQGLGRDLMVLAEYRPDLALLLLNRLRKLDSKNLESIRELVILIRKEAQDPEKIVELYRNHLNDYWMAKLVQTVERMQKTVETQISVAQLSTTAPASKTSMRETPKECPQFRLNTSADAEYWRSLADIADAEVRSARENANSWRDIAKQAAQGADQAAEDGNSSSEAFQRNKARELLERAAEYEAQAASKEDEAADLRRKADASDRKRCETRSRPVETAKAPEPASPHPVLVPVPSPAPASTPKPTDDQEKVCGPDISAFVMGVLDKIQEDWDGWDQKKRGEKCSQLTSLLTGNRAWDITYLSPAIAPPNEDKFSKLKATGSAFYNNFSTRDEFLENNSFYFEGQKPNMCAKPRDPCWASVNFFGQCMHAQQVNYVQWGFMNKLCDQSAYPYFLHSARNTVQFTKPWITAAQRIASGIGAYYPEAVEESLRPQQSSDPGAAAANLVRNLEAKMKALVLDPDHSAFLSPERPEAGCTKKCSIVFPATDDVLRYKWGAGGLEDLER